MKFEYIEMEKPGSIEVKDFVFTIPKEISGIEIPATEEKTYLNNSKLVGQVRNVGSEVVTIDCLDHNTRNYPLKNCIRLKFPITSLVASFDLYSRIITEKLSPKAKKIIKSILAVIKPEGKVFISRMLLDISVQYYGLSIFCDNKKIAFYFKNEFVLFEIEKEENYEEDLQVLFGKLELKNKKTFVLCARKALKTASKYGLLEVKKNTENLHNQMVPVMSYLREGAREYVENKIGLKKLNELSLPKEVAGLVAASVACACEKQEEMEKQKQVFSMLSKQIANSEETYSFCKRGNIEIKNDYDFVTRLLKKGIIEKLSYEEGTLSWVYAPMDYQLGEKWGNIKVFLGRVKIEIREKDSIPLIFFVSYKTEVREIGTIHSMASSSGSAYCSGTFNSVIQKLLAAKRIGDLILLFKSYLQSYNPESPYSNGGRRDWDAMSIDGPNVCDDSYEVWKKKANYTPKEKVTA